MGLKPVDDSLGYDIYIYKVSRLISSEVLLYCDIVTQTSTGFLTIRIVSVRTHSLTRPGPSVLISSRQKV